MRSTRNNSLIKLWQISEKKYLFFLQFFCKIYLSLVAVYISQLARKIIDEDIFSKQLETVLLYFTVILLAGIGVSCLYQYCVSEFLETEESETCHSKLSSCGLPWQAGGRMAIRAMKIYDFHSTNAQPMNTPAYIDFCNVTFSYDGANNVLTDFNLQVREGEHVALIGESGCGKSTLTKLLLGLYEIQGGEIYVAGQSISHMTLEQLRQLFSYVPQDPELFHVSVMENIRYGKVTATDEEVIMAAKKANADAFIRELEQGYDTMIGEQGDNLSGGQRQRIAIARALLKDAPIFIFDEATSALDNETERKINESIEVCGDKTIIVVAHRESALRNMDRIIDLTEGK